MDKYTIKMSSPATLGDESSPWQSSAGEDDPLHEESMLKRKLAILEEFMENGKSHHIWTLFDGFSVKDERGNSWYMDRRCNYVSHLCEDGVMTAMRNHRSIFLSFPKRSYY